MPEESRTRRLAILIDADCQRRWETRPHAGARVGQFRAVFSDGRAWVSALARALPI